ncbi:MAG: efflux RND transporter periplasmic adaptor subunit [Nitrosomonas sp.]|nr:efflux RND transporter periplasmic adaptor subunit [Nitrosomonas sp.]
MPNIKKILRIAVIPLFAIVLAYTGWAMLKEDKQEVELVAAERGVVEATVVNTRAGTIKACRRSRLSPATGGQIVSLPVKEGDRVVPGQVLLKLWNADLNAQHELAKQQHNTARSRQQEACILAKNAERESMRTQQLVARGFVSSQRADDAKATAQSRQAACTAAAADVKRAQAQTAVIAANLERTVLVAPFAGIIAQVTGELGEYVTPSPQGIPTPPAVDLIDDSCLYVSAPMDEVDAPKIQVGQTARITLDAITQKNFAGKVRRIAPYVTEIEKQARTVEIEAEFVNPDTDIVLLVGYSADVEVITQRHDAVLRIPTRAIRQGNKILVVDENGRLVERTLTTGLANWVYTEVTEGLNEGEQVLLEADDDTVTVGTPVIATPSRP